MMISKTPIFKVRTYSMCGMRTFSFFYLGTCVFKLGFRTAPVRRPSVSPSTAAIALRLQLLQSRLDTAFPMPMPKIEGEV